MFIGKLFAFVFLLIAIFLLYHAYHIDSAEVHTHSQFHNAIDVETMRSVVVLVGIICLVAAAAFWIDSRV